MIRITLSLSEGKRLAALLSPDALDAIVRTVAFSIERRVKTSMVGPKSGRVYKRGKRKHRASAPGETPAIDTGNLINSIRTFAERPARWAVGVGAYYGLILETSLLRPFLGPAVEAEGESFKQVLAAIFRRAQ